MGQNPLKDRHLNVGVEVTRVPLWAGAACQRLGCWRPRAGMYYDCVWGSMHLQSLISFCWQSHFKTGGGEKSNGTDLATVLTVSMLEVS
eukprot:2489223-Amphidinium_carterae.1